MASCRHCGIRFIADPRNAKRQDLGCPFGCGKHHRKRSSTQRVNKYRDTKIGKEKKRRLNARRYRVNHPSHRQASEDCATCQSAALGNEETIAPGSPSESGGCEPDQACGCIAHETAKDAFDETNDAETDEQANGCTDENTGCNLVDEELKLEELKLEELNLEELILEELNLEGVVLREAALAESSILPYVQWVINLIERLTLSCEQVVECLTQALRQRSLAFRKRREYILKYLNKHPPQPP